MYGPGSSKENGVGGLNRKLPFLNVHTTGKKVFFFVVCLLHQQTHQSPTKR